MKCAICDMDDDTVTAFNTDCRVCQAVIYDTIASYDVEEEEVIEETIEFDESKPIGLHYVPQTY